MNETNMSGSAKFLVPGAVIVAGLLIAGAVVWNNQHPANLAAGGGQQPAAAAAVAVDIAKVKVDGEPYIGQANAAVTIAFWSDFQCPFCKQFEISTLPQIVQQYVSAGKVKVVFKDFAFLGQDSNTAGEYARAMWKLYPDKYFEWRAAMYTAQDQEGDQGFGDEPSIKMLTAKITGVDASKVASDVATNKSAYDDAMTADRTEAQTFGISATPSFVIGKQMIAGAQPFATFDSALKLVLK